MELEEAIEILEEASGLEGSERGDYWGFMGCVGDALQSWDYLMDRQFREQCGKAVVDEAKLIQNEWAIIEEEYQPPVVKRKSIKYLGD